jgi:hypothetical protein
MNDETFGKVITAVRGHLATVLGNDAQSHTRTAVGMVYCVFPNSFSLVRTLVKLQTTSTIRITNPDQN